MKKIIYLIALIGIVSIGHAQNVSVDQARRVSTKGYAEKEVTPDIIYLSVSLREYYVDGNTKKKVAIETLEKQLFDAALKNGVKQEDLTIQNIYSYNYETKKNKNQELLQARQYRIKVTDLSKLNSLFDEVDPRGMQSTSISEYDHSQKRQIERELKTEAVKDARTNAEVLATADGQTIGKALLINDNSSFSWNDVMPTGRVYAMSAKFADAEMADESSNINISIRPIKLVANVDAVFELKGN
ncbi:SIMPL domain-containing protein [Sphingobacterium corticis]|uniref:SIMPL domain-containing protein n=1 Tax=Sphingobacterium corticis TaxID=1812823 RepID=A0ABW5NH69_9SPHI